MSVLAEELHRSTQDPEAGDVRLRSQELRLRWLPGAQARPFDSNHTCAVPLRTPQLLDAASTICKSSAPAPSVFKIALGHGRFRPGAVVDNDHEQPVHVEERA